MKSQAMKTPKPLQALYHKFRKAGYTPPEALYSAKVWTAFEELESQGLVRLQADYEEECYFDVFGEPEGYIDENGQTITPEQEKANIIDMIERLGNYYIYSQARCSECGQWQTLDSVGHCVGYEYPLSPYDNCYVVDLCQAAIDHVQQAQTH